MHKWKIKEFYEGVFDDERVICYCNDIMTAATIIDGMRLLRKGRPFTYQAQYVGENWEEDKATLVFTNPITDETTDFSKYVYEGISSLGGLK